MSLRLILLFIWTIPFSLIGQNIFQSEELFGLEFEGETIYNADYNEIIFHDYFIYGRKGKYWHILSENRQNHKKAYKKFMFHLSSELLVVGITDENKMDLISEDGSFYYLEDGDYDRVELSEYNSDTHDRDILLVSKNGKLGFYNWVKKSELIPPLYDRLQIHDGCESSGKVIYMGIGRDNVLFSENQGQLFSFKASAVDDIYPSTVCEGYILKYGQKIGYIREKRNGKMFLIKPIYEDLYFPTGNPNIIKVEAFGKYGLYNGNSMILKCRYTDIEVIDGNYIFAVATKYRKMLDVDKVYKVNKEGKLVNI